MRTPGILVCLFVLACGGGSKKPAATPAEPASSAGDEAKAPAEGGEAAAPVAAAPKPLFDRLGGLPAIKAVVEEFVARTTSDARIKERFFNTDAENLKRLLTEFVCQATGGPCKYTGRDMPNSHAGMDLVDDEFNEIGREHV